MKSVSSRRPDPLGVAADLLEGGAAHQQVGARGARPDGVVDVRALAEEVARGAVAGGQRARVGDAGDVAGDRAHALADRLGEEAVQQVAGATTSESRNRIQSLPAAAAPTLRAWEAEASPSARATIR